MAKTVVNYSLTELKAAFELTGKFAEDANYFVRTLSEASDEEKKRASFYNALYTKLQNKIDEKLHEINDNLE